jgi:hypothetical protein
VGLQELKCGIGGAGQYTFLDRIWNGNQELSTGFLGTRKFYQQSGKVSFLMRFCKYLIRDCRLDVIVLHVHVPTDKIGYVKDSFYEELDRAFDKSSKFYVKI